MGLSSQLPEPLLQSNKSWKVAIVKAQFNNDITDKILNSALASLNELGYEQTQIKTFVVAGALEIPLVAKWCCTNGYDGVIAIGVVIRGETTHYEYVCNGVERGCMQVQIEQQKPIIQAVLTVENKAQALDRCGGSHGDKGKEAAQTLTGMLNIKTQILK